MDEITTGRKMIISHKHKYIFVHVSKIGGTSIEQILWKHKGPKDISTTPLYQTLKLGSKGHTSSQEIKEAFPNEWDIYFKFGFTRNPWSRMVSRYLHINKKKFNWNKSFSDLRKGFIEHIINIDIEAVKKPYTPLDPKRHPFHPLTMLSINSEIAVDYVGKMEELDKEFTFVCRKIGIPQQSLPKANKNKYNKWHYSEWYTNEARDKVTTLFPKTIEIFGYIFEDQR